MKVDGVEIVIQSDAKQANKELDSLNVKLGQLNNSLYSINGSSLIGFSKSLNSLLTAMKSMNGVDSTSFNRLTKNLNKAATVDISSMQRLSSALYTMGKSVSSINGFGGNVQAISDMMAQLSKAPLVANNTIQMTNALANLASQGNKVGSASKSLNGLLYSSPKETGNAIKSTGSLFTAFSKLGGAIYATKAIYRGFASVLKSTTGASMDFLETVNYFEVATKQIGINSVSAWKENGYNSAEEYADSFSSRLKELTEKMTGYSVDQGGNAIYSGVANLGMNPNSVMQWQATYAQMADSLGVTGETALATAEALTMLGADWASLKNISLDSAWEKFASALAGQSRAVRSLGIDITNATLAETAMNYGIETKIKDMTQAEKAQLRLIALLDRSQVAFGDMARTINTPANQLRILQEKFDALARTIGNLFLPIVQKALPYITGLTIALQRLFSWVGKLFGIDMSKIGAPVGSASDAVNNLYEGIDDSTSGLEDADKAAKKLKATIYGYDELHVATDNSSGSSSDKTGNVSGGFPVLDTAIQNSLDDYKDAWDKAFAEMEQKAEKFADNIANIAKYSMWLISTGFNKSFVSDKSEEVSKNIDRIKQSNARVWNDPEVQEAQKRYFDTTMVRVGSTAGAMYSIGTSLAYGVSEGVADAKESMEEFNAHKIAGTYNNMADTNEQLTKFNTVLAEIGTAFENSSFSSIVEFFTKMKDFFTGNIAERATGFMKDLTKIFTDPIAENSDSIKSILENVMKICDNLLAPAKKLLEILVNKDTDYENSWLHKLMTSFNNTNVSVTSGWLNMVNTALEKLAGFTLDHNGLTFFDSLKEKFQSIVDFIQPAIDKFTGFYDRVKSIFEGLGIVIKATWIVFSGWFETNVINPLVSKFAPIGEKISKFFSDGWEKIKSIWTTVSGWFDIYVCTPISNVFNTLWTGMKGGVSSAMNVVIGALESAINFIIGGVNNLVGGFNKFVSVGAKIAGESWSGVEVLPTISIPRIPAYVTGGFPEDGLFMANHNELVGGFSNGRTAVANNEQIVEGIKAGVIDAMMTVLTSTNGQNNDEKMVIENHVRIGDADLLSFGYATYKALNQASKQKLIPKFF